MTVPIEVISSTVERPAWKLRSGQRFIDNEGDIWRITSNHYDHGERESTLTLAPELLYWHLVAGGLTTRTYPGHEPGVVGEQCFCCRGLGQLYNFDGRRWWPVECWRCDGSGVWPR